MEPCCVKFYTRATAGSVTFAFPREATISPLWTTLQRGMIVGFVSVTDLSGHVKVLSPECNSAAGVAWSPDGKEVWFTAAQKGNNRELLAVNLSGQIRKVLDLPAGMTLEDVAPDGRVLVSLDAERLAMATSARDGKPMDSPGLIGTLPKTFRAMGSRYCSKKPVRPLGPTIHLPFRRIDSTPRCNWARAAGAACLRTANGRFPSCRASQDR